MCEDQNVLETLHDEFMEYQSLPDSEIPTNVWEDAKISSQYSNKNDWYRMGII